MSIIIAKPPYQVNSELNKRDRGVREVLMECT